MGDPVTAAAAAQAMGGTGMASAGALPGIVGGFGALAPAVNPVSAGFMSGLAMPATITGLGKDIGALNTFMNQNPITSQIGFGLAKDMFTPQQTMVAPGQVSRGQIAPVDFMSLLNPQQSTVIRPAMPSLL